ncbi:MAG: deoxyribonuclease IV [Ignavibacteriales bacterium]|nr:deoxyribonuclease IV [Ignavibacteriales bacterium]
MAHSSILLGAHMSIAGGVHTAVERGTSIGCTALQLFVKNNNQWSGKPITDEAAVTYKEVLAKSTIQAPVMAHATYLINLCAKNKIFLKKSRAAFKDELDRCEKLGVAYLNVHPGSHMDQGMETGIKLIAESLNLVHDQTNGYTTLSVLEATAGQGSAVGYTFEHLRGIIDLVEKKNRMAVCIDTCHIFAAGYDIKTEEGYLKTFKEFDEIVGFDRLVAFHVNDSKKGLGSRVDRHEHIGNGEIGLEGFRLLMNDIRFAHIPKILETPKSEDLHEDVENMKVLEGLMTKKKS